MILDLKSCVSFGSASMPSCTIQVPSSGLKCDTVQFALGKSRGSGKDEGYDTVRDAFDRCDGIDGTKK